MSFSLAPDELQERVLTILALLSLNLEPRYRYRATAPASRAR